jgi:periplasmic protein TonB
MSMMPKEMQSGDGGGGDLRDAARYHAWDMPRRELQGSHLVIAAVSVACIFGFGIYLLHRVPVGPPAGRAGDAIQQVRLVPSSTAAAPPHSSAAPAENLPPPQPTATAIAIPPPKAAASSAEPKLAAKAMTPSTAKLSAPFAVAELEAPPSPSQIDAAASNAMFDFQKVLFDHVERYRHYPEGAGLQNLQGVVELLFTMDRRGTVLGVWVKKSSGSARLDQAAIDTIRRAQPMPPIPPGLPDRVEVLLPVAAP